MCENCRYCTVKLTYLGFRDWCKLYKTFQTIKCADWAAK